MLQLYDVGTVKRKANLSNASLLQMHAVPVLVIGGGLVGLSAAVTLRHQGVPTVLIEKHLGSSLHPRAIGFTVRTLEIFRSCGFAHEVPQVDVDGQQRPRRVTVESLAGNWKSSASDWTPKTGGTAPQNSVEYSPCRGAALSQDLLEPIIRAKAQQLGAELLLGVELIRLEQDADGVTAFVRKYKTEEEFSIRGCYAIAADGNRSIVRDSLGIGRSGRGFMKVVRSVLFRTQNRSDLDCYLEKGASQFQIEQSDFSAFLTTYRDGRWVLMFSDDFDRDEKELKKCVEKVIGRNDLNIEIITTGMWELSALISDSFQKGRIFLAGDAAHTLPPTRGGYGANTGIEDVHNLAWKISMVVNNHSHPDILQTYDSERRPISWLRHQQTFARPDYANEAGNSGAAGDGTIFDDNAMEIGQLYRSAATLASSDLDLPKIEKLPAAAKPDQWNGQVGTRAPHIWIQKKNMPTNNLSTLDLFGNTWILLSAGDHTTWANATNSFKQKFPKFPFEHLCLGTDVIPVEGKSTLASLCGAFGLSEGAVLVRPDGYIGWKAERIPMEPEFSFVDVMKKVGFLRQYQ